MSIRKIIDGLKPQLHEVEIKSLGVKIFVRGLTVAEYDEYLASDDVGIAKKIVSWCACEEDGTQLFPSEDLGGVPRAALNEIVDAISAITGGRVDELKKS